MAKKKTSAPAAPAAVQAGAPASVGEQAGTGEGTEQGSAETAIEQATSGGGDEAGAGVDSAQAGSQESGGANPELTQEQQGPETPEPDLATTQASELDLATTQAPELEPEEPQYPVTDVLRNNSSAEFACRATGLLLSPGASRAVTIRDAEHLLELAAAIEAFDRAQPRAGLLKFDRVAL